MKKNEENLNFLNFLRVQKMKRLIIKKPLRNEEK